MPKFGSRNFSFGAALVQQMLRRGLLLPNSATERRQTKRIYTKKATRGGYTHIVHSSRVANY